VAIKLDYAAIYLLCILLIKYTFKTYPEDVPRSYESFLVSSALGMLITAIVLTPKIFTLLHNDFVLFLFEIIILGFFTLLVTFLRKRKGFTHSLIGAIILLSCLVIQVVKYTLLVEPHYFSFLWGYMILFFLQSVTISQQVAVR